MDSGNRKTLALAFVFGVAAFFFSYTVSYSHAFSAGGCDEDCKKCHSLSNQEVKEIVKKMDKPDLKIVNTQLSMIKGLWEVNYEEKGTKGIFYVDFSKKYLVPGPINIIEISTKINKTAEKIEKIKESIRVDVSRIPLKNALVVGNTKAPKKVIVFTDPD